MSGDTARLFWSCVIAWIIGTSAPRVAAGDTWGMSIAQNITAGLLGIIMVGMLTGVVVALHTLWERVRRKPGQMQTE
jgi:hypothetical protein